jgi:hypothetical protein
MRGQIFARQRLDAAPTSRKFDCQRREKRPPRRGRFPLGEGSAQGRAEGSPQEILFHFRTGRHRAWVASPKSGRARPPQQSVDLIIT